MAASGVVIHRRDTAPSHRSRTRCSACTASSGCVRRRRFARVSHPHTSTPCRSTTPSSAKQGLSPAPARASICPRRNENRSHVQPVSGMPAAAQKETFQTLLSDTLADECSCEVVQAVHDQLCELVEEHRERKEAEPLTLSKGAVKCVLKSCGVSDSHVEEFALRYDDAFGADMALSPRNLVEKQIEVCTPDVVIKVSPERSDLVDTRVIDGVKYILIRADEGVEVNGVPVHIAK